MAARPYGSFGIDKLEKLVNGSSADPEVLRRVLAELDHRKSDRAKALRAQIEKTLSSPRSRAAPQSRGSSARKTIGSATRSAKSLGRKTTRPSQRGVKTAADAASGATSPTTTGAEADYEVLARKYELLRETFTLEAEILARWGMTSSMPDELRALVFKAWETRLSATPDEYGRSLHELEEDRRRVDQERDSLSDERRRD